jgi:hypothetical protein
MSTKAKKLAIKEWIPELKSRTEARAKRGIGYVPEAEMEDYSKLLTDVRQRYSAPPAPAMPVTSNANTSQLAAEDCGDRARGDSGTKHNENIAMAGYVSDHWFGLVHTPISVQDWEGRGLRPNQKTSSGPIPQLVLKKNQKFKENHINFNYL